jgi:hypothetical protein
MWLGNKRPFTFNKLAASEKNPYPDQNPKPEKPTKTN